MPPAHDEPDISGTAVDAPRAEEVGALAWPLLFRRRLQRRVEGSEHQPWIVLAASLFGLGTVTFTITILAVSIPTIAGDLDTTESNLTWLITGPILVFGIVGPGAGKLGDLWGHRRVYLIGMAGATIFAGLTALAWSAPALITFPVLGATPGEATGPASMALINRVFSREQRVQAMGYWSMVMAGGPVLGVVAGGPIVEAFGWRWIFAAQVPLTIAGLLVAAIVLPETTRARRVRFDWAGTLLLASAIAAALFALNRGPALGWGSPTVLGLFVAAPMLLSAFVAVERRTDSPLIPLRYFRRRNFAFSIANVFFTQFAYMGGFILTPLLLQNVLGYGETRTGLLSISRPLMFAIAGPIAGYLAVRIGERTSAVTGAGAIALSMVGLAAVGPASSDLLIIGALGLSGIGLGACAPAMAASIANAVDEGDLGVAGATQQMMAQVGVVAGIQLMQTVQVSREPMVGLVESYGQAYLLGGAVCVLGLVAALFVRSTRRDGPPAFDADQRERDTREAAPLVEVG
ncbi:DHA2 family efflux MFS transporter permease subunit [soil metagenome]